MEQKNKIGLMLFFTLLWYLTGSIMGGNIDCATWDVGGRFLWGLAEVIIVCAVQFHDVD